MNLIVNARDAMPSGGLITIKTENVIVDEEYCRLHLETRPGDFICLSVQDTGIGMDKSTINRIFEPFFTSKEKGKGTGLGLSIVYGIIKQHKGWVDVDSQPNKGTTFMIYLPVITEKVDQEPEKEIIPADKTKGNGERILLTEDDKNACKFAARILRQNGYEVFEAENAAEAQDIFEKGKRNFHLVFTDVVLPDKNGLQLAEELLSSKPDLKIILCSGYVDDKSRLDTIKQKGYKFLQKPYTVNDLLKTIRETINA